MKRQEQNNPGRLYLLPTPLRSFSDAFWSKESVSAELPAEALRLFSILETFIVESERSAARLLSSFRDREGMERLKLLLLNEHSVEADLAGLLEPLLGGQDCGLLSEAGMPCIADPGAALVAEAQERGIQVVPISGPSSIFLALAASGLSGQSFTFLGYLPAERTARKARLMRLATEFQKDGLTRIFIEAPYRNDALLADCVAVLPESAWLAIAADLDGDRRLIHSRSLGAWRAAPLPTIGKLPAVFLFGKRAPVRPSEGS
ncbi:MAG: SAM-dependent methyltransferase [Spirochaetes bacterium]|nr:SAM-dependent methyltransferase [Spirochaetota bacterium]